MGAAGLGDAIALDQARGEPGLAGRTAAYLDEQTRLLRLQAEGLRERHALDLAHLRHRRWTDRLGLALQALVMAVGLAAAGLMGVAAWDAAHDHDLVVEPFTASPDLAARGVTGVVLATHLIDRLAALRLHTESNRAAASYGEGAPGMVRVELPQTAISLGEVKRYLVELVGHESRVSGDAVRTPRGGLAVTARLGGLPGRTFEGADGDLDRLVDLAAEQVFCSTQAYRCALHLEATGRHPQAMEVLDHLARTDASNDRLWAFWSLAEGAISDGDDGRAISNAKAGLAIDPNFPLLHDALADAYARTGEAQALLVELRTAEHLLQRPQPALTPDGLADLRQAVAADLASATGDYQAALSTETAALRRQTGEAAWPMEVRRLRDLMQLHDFAAVRAALGSMAPRADRPGRRAELAIYGLQLALEAGDRPALAAATETLRAALAAAPAQRTPGLAIPTLARGQIALGDLDGADATLRAAPTDCYDCAIARAELARGRGDAHAADSWFIRAAALGPGLPFADEAWGQVELGRGHLSVAPGRFAAAAQKGPRWADPLKGWGDVLARQGLWRDAAARYDAALKLAPNWPALQQARAAAEQHLH